MPINYELRQAVAGLQRKVDEEKARRREAAIRNFEGNAKERARWKAMRTVIGGGTTKGETLSFRARSAAWRICLPATSGCRQRAAVRVTPL